MRLVSRRWTTEEVWAVGFCLVLAFVGMFNRELDYADEPRVTAISLEMSRDGNVVVPHLGGTPFVEKPPMYFASGAGVFRLFGGFLEPASVMRLTSVLWGIGVLVATFFLARRLAEPRLETDAEPGKTPASSALLTTAVLMTMIGFVTNMHTIRVDIALAFFVVASVWAFAEVYLGERPSFLSLAALFLAGAFLSKGLIGIVLVGIAWCGLAVPWFVAKWREAKFRDLRLAHHFVALGVFLAAAGSWIVLLRIVGGEAVWDEWFWRNQVGRFLGNASLGHERPGRPFYYLVGTANYTLPWVPLIVLWIWRVYRDLRARGKLSRGQIFLAVWFLGSVVILTAASTKRRVYLLPLLPAYALMCGEVLRHELPRLFREVYRVWIGGCLALLALLALAPAFWGFLPAPLLRLFNGVPAQWSFWNVAIGVGVIALLIHFPRRAPPFRIVSVTALTFIGIIAIGEPLVENARDLRAMVERFIPQVDRDRRARTAGFLSESMLGLLYIHAGWAPRQVGEERFQRIIGKRDPDYDCVITNRVDLPVFLENPYLLLARESTGGGDDESARRKRRTRTLQWITGRSEGGGADTVKPAKSGSLRGEATDA